MLDKYQWKNLSTLQGYNSPAPRLRRDECWVFPPHALHSENNVIL